MWVLSFLLMIVLPADPLSAVAFMTGNWSGKTNGVMMEEVWTAPAGGIMLGMHRDVFGDNKAFFEYLRIEVRGESLVYLASPRGRGETAFTYSGGDTNRAIFENPDNEYPKRIIYSLDEQGGLVARIDDGSDADPKARSWRWTKTP